MIPFEQIRETEDRSWSFRLLEIIESGQLDELDEILDTISDLDDYRLEKRLTELMLNSQQPLAVREAASDALSLIPTTESDEARRMWWYSGDPVLERHAIQNALRVDADIIEDVASDPLHPYHLDAIVVLGYSGLGWEEPKYQALKIKALSHPNPDVREAAANGLVWDEPVAAETELLKVCQEESIGDTALSTLVRYKSRALLLALHELQTSGPVKLRDCYRKTFDQIAEEFERAIDLPSFHSEAARTYLTGWIKPVMDLLPKERDDGTSDYFSNDPKPAPLNMNAAEIIADLSRDDDLWAKKKSKYWRGVTLFPASVAEQNELAEFFCSSANPEVRIIGCQFLAKWGMGHRLLTLLSDRNLGVRKCAAYHFEEVSPNEQFAEHLWTLVSNQNVQGCHLWESLKSYVVQAPASDDPIVRLTDLARNDERESARVWAISELERIKEKDAIVSLLPLLSQPPLCTWGVHISLLDACVKLAIDVPRVAALSEIDNPEVQHEIARLIEAGLWTIS